MPTKKGFGVMCLSKWTIWNNILKTKERKRKDRKGDKMDIRKLSHILKWDDLSETISIKLIHIQLVY